MSDMGSPRRQSKPARAKAKRPLYQRLAEGLRRRLLGAEMVNGARLPPLRELARQFRVSTITVRQALRILEEEGHLYCVPGTGTFVRGGPPVPPRRDPITVAYAAAEIVDSLSIEITRGIEEACQELGWGLQVCSAGGDIPREARNLRRLTECGAAGAIVLPTCNHANHEVLFKLKLANFPFVLVDRAIAGLKVDLVESDHEKGAFLATSHLIEQGPRRVLMVTEPPVLSSLAARIEGYERSLTRHGLEPTQAAMIWIEPHNAEAEAGERPRWFRAYQAALPALRKMETPVAIFASNAYAGWGVVMACRELGLRIPDDVAVACFDNNEIVQALTPSLTSVAHRTFEIGHKAVALLERRIQSNELTEPEHVVVEVDLIERESVASPAAA